MFYNACNAFIQVLHYANLHFNHITQPIFLTKNMIRCVCPVIVCHIPPAHVCSQVQTPIRQLTSPNVKLANGTVLRYSNVRPRLKGFKDIRGKKIEIFALIHFISWKHSN